MARHDDMVVPVHHSTISGVSATAVGGIKGAIKGGIGGYLTTTLLCVAAGAAICAGPMGWSLLPGIIGGGFLGGLAATVVIAPTVGTLTSIIGAARDGSHAAHRVYLEKGSATMLDAQVAASQAQASMQTNVYAGPGADNKYNFPAQGSALNPALSSVQADSAQAQGVVSGQQLQRA